MMLKPRKGFRLIVKILEFINPFLVIFSIIGLFMEYTYLKQYVVPVNQIISIIFVFDFLLRLAAHNPFKYFVKSYGWVDFLASLPGFMLFLGSTPLLSMFKIVRIGRFFRIIRILRFLRVFNFLKKMKSDSSWVQDRIMQIGVTIVLISVVGIVFVDNRVQRYLIDLKYQSVVDEYEALNNNIGKLMGNHDEIALYVLDSKVYNRYRSPINNIKQLKENLSDDMENHLVIPFNMDSFSFSEELDLPTKGIIMHEGVIREYHNTVMLLLLTTLLVILTVIIFYMGFKFARDMQVVQLVIDSFDAGDYMLLTQESEQYRNENGELKIESGESEIISLLKVSANMATANNQVSTGVMFSGLGNIDSEEDDNFSFMKDINEHLDSIDKKIDTSSERLIKETIKKVTPAITKYISDIINKKKS